MAGTQRHDPFSGGHFLVEIDGLTRASFESVSGLTAFAHVEEYREGGDNVVRKEIGEVEYENIELHAGLDANRELYDWWNTVATGTPSRRNLSVVLLDSARREVARWNVREAVPVRYTVSNLDARDDNVVLEVLELAHEGIERAA